MHQVQAENPEDIKHAIPARTFFARLAELQSPSCLWMGTCQKENDRLQRCLESLSGKSTLTADSVFKSIRHQARSRRSVPSHQCGAARPGQRDCNGFFSTVFLPKHQGEILILWSPLALGLGMIDIVGVHLSLDNDFIAERSGTALEHAGL